MSSQKFLIYSKSKKLETTWMSSWEHKFGSSKVTVGGPHWSSFYTELVEGKHLRRGHCVTGTELNIFTCVLKSS